MSTPQTGAGAALSRAIVGALVAAQACDVDRFVELGAALRGPMTEHVDTVLSAVVRDLLERQHPEGLAGEDIVEVLDRCVRDALWLPGIDARTLVVVLLGALGISETAFADDTSEQSQDPLDAAVPDPPSEADLRRHALLMAASLCSATGERPIRAVEAAISEIRRAETQEMP